MGWWSTSLVILCAWATLASSLTVADLRCNHQQCVDDGYDIDTTVHTFTVEGHNMFIRYADGDPFDMYCGEWQALDSPAIPSFPSMVSVSSVDLSACPLPATRSLVEALAAINVTLQQTGETTLELTDLPAEPQLTAKYFNGLEKITNLWISTSVEQTPTPDFSFLMKLNSLRSLNIASVPLPADVDLPSTLASLSLISTTVRPLLDMLRATSNLRKLTLKYNEIGRSNAVPKDIDAQETNPSVLEELLLTKWKEQRLVPLERCESLKKIELSLPLVEELPNRWVASCPRLENVNIYGAENLVSLPPKLLEGATALKSLSITVGLLETLPNAFLEDAPNLINLDLSSNNFKTLSSAALAAPVLQTLLVERNELETLEGLGSLSSLTSLSAAYNPLGNLCDQNGYSSLKDLTQLKELNLRGLNITHTCKDWRENMRFLTELYLDNTQISELGLADFIYTRDPNVKNVTLYLNEAPLTTIRFTEDDYKKAIAMPIETTVLLRTHADLKCDCDMYWTWKTLVNVKNTHWVNIRCPDLIPLQVKSMFEVCPERFGQ